MVSIDDAVEVAADWVGQGARTLHIIDLDGAFSGSRKNAYIMEDIISKFDVDVQVAWLAARQDPVLALAHE